jgi:hypothetical protein
MLAVCATIGITLLVLGILGLVGSLSAAYGGSIAMVVIGSLCLINAGKLIQHICCD